MTQFQLIKLLHVNFDGKSPVRRGWPLQKWLERHNGGQFFVETDVISKVRSFSLNSLFRICDFSRNPTKNFQNDKTSVRKLLHVNIRLYFWRNLVPPVITSWNLVGFLRRTLIKFEKVIHWVKSVPIRSYSGPYLVRIRENTDQINFEYGHFSRSDN